MRLLYRSVDVHQAFEATVRGPQLGVSNHFGGLSDPLIQIYALDRVPRVIGRDLIWKYPVAKQLMNFVGAIPVHKPDDSVGGGVARNDQMFASTYAALEDGDLVVIFPEGITVDDPAIAPIKTGAARIALGARAQGVTGIEIIPSGIHYEDKAVLRSKAYVHVGDPIDLDAWVEEHAAPGEAQDSSNRALVTELTAAIESLLRRAAPNFEDWQEARTMMEASAIALRNVPGASADVGYGDESALSDELATRSEGDKERIGVALDVYEADLDAAGLTDEQMMSRQSSRASFLWRVVWNAGVGLVLLPFALIGLVINILPMVGVWLVGKVRVAPAMMATLKPGAAIVLFSIAWGFAAWSGWKLGGFRGVAAVLLLMPLYLFALVAVVERVTLAGRAIGGRARSGGGDLHESVVEDRTAVVESVADAL